MNIYFQSFGVVLFQSVNLQRVIPSCLISICVGISTLFIPFTVIAMPHPKLLTDPFLQLPTQGSVRVVWFTEFPGTEHIVYYGNQLQHVTIANTSKLTKMREDLETDNDSPTLIERDIWRHEAEITGLSFSERIPYQVKSVHDNGEAVTSDRFSLAPLPSKGIPQKILLTSDHQLKPMTPANLQKVVETVGSVDAVFFAGDLVNVPDRASEWFEADNAFFPSLQGKAKSSIHDNNISYSGGAIIQFAPLFPTIGNHEVMGRFSMKTSLGQQFNDPIPKWVASDRYALRSGFINPKNDPKFREEWIKHHSFNTDTYEEIFSLPDTGPGGEKYYATSFGDVRLISLFLTHIWRSPNPNAKGRYQEKIEDSNNPENWGYGQHIFEPITPGSPQYEWLKSELQNPEFQQAKYKVVMFHHPPHSLGDNVVPAFTDPIQSVIRGKDGKIKEVLYEYPKNDDYLICYVLPLLEDTGVQLVLYGHTHIWNRFMSPSGLHFLESSNVGNSYGAYTEDSGNVRILPKSNEEQYVGIGNPNGLDPIIPSISPLTNEKGQPLAYVASNEITVFSILDTGRGVVSSYRFDTREPNAKVIKFDEFLLVP